MKSGLGTGEAVQAFGPLCNACWEPMNSEVLVVCLIGFDGLGEDFSVNLCY